MDPLRIWYQSYVDYDNGKVYWDRLRKHLNEIVDPGTTVDIFKFITPLTPEENRHLEYLARRDVGTPYDYRGIVRFLTRQRDARSRRLFCSEQVFARCQQIGRPLLDRTEAWRVPPDWLARSPHLALDQTIVTA